MKLKEKVALITGAGRGLGREIALLLARQGADCAIADVNDADLNAVSTEITALNVRCESVVLDVSNLESCEKAANKIIDKLGKIDILINNAGITRDTLFLRMQPKDWESVISVNLTGTFNCTKAVLKGMIKQRYGKIVNVASIIGLMGNVGQANYAASKAGIIGLTKSVAKEVGSRNITVNAIAPGFIATKMTDVLAEDVKKAMLKQIPLARFGSPEDVANLVLFLASDDSSYITGQVMQIDGGMLM